jgi:hypothetical protein
MGGRVIPGCVILAPHLGDVEEKRSGLASEGPKRPNGKSATACVGKTPNELYNGGQAFKITARDSRGVMVTLIADNYFGYCKKEVKTQISYSANLYGLAEEEHAGGAIAFASYDLGVHFVRKND